MIIFAPGLALAAIKRVGCKQIEVKYKFNVMIFKFNKKARL
jgi:hypothetical protein